MKQALLIGLAASLVATGAASQTKPKPLKPPHPATSLAKFEDGDQAARAGTALYNELNKSQPLPIVGGTVIQDTISNMGAGQTPIDAWKDASESNSGLATWRAGDEAGSKLVDVTCPNSETCLIDEP